MSRLANRTARLRQIEELLLLAPEGRRVTDIARRLGVARRTVYRDLDFLSQDGVPLWEEGGRYGINRTHYLATIRLTFHEAIALVLAGLLLARTIDERNPHVASALRKLAMIMPVETRHVASLRAYLERAAERVQMHSDGRQQVAVLEAVAEGWGAGRKVRVDYRSPRSGQLRPRVIAPYALEPTASGIYLIGYDDWANALRTFKLDRLEGAELLDDRFTIPADFDLVKYLADSWSIMAGSGITEVALRFSPAATPQVRERRWHPSQTLQPAADGGCTLRVRVSEPLEMQPWIRSWGAQVEVLEPQWLRDQIATELREAALLYDGVTL